MSSSRYVGRHGNPGRHRFSLPSVGGSGVARTALKSVAGVGIVLGSGAFVIAPSSAIGGAMDTSAIGAEQSISAAELLAERESEGSEGSRSAERDTPAAITAPTKADAQSGTGALGIEPVAKPKPKPKPEPESDEEKDEAETTEESVDVKPTPEPEPEPESAETSESTSRSESQEGSSDSSGAAQAGGYEAEAAGLGLGPNASRVYSAVRNQFPDMTNIGGYRAGDPGDHGSGRAVDVMVTGSRGDQVNAWLQAHAGELNIKYIIWQQRIWFPNGSSKMMADRGSATANHYDHVHVSVN